MSSDSEFEPTPPKQRRLIPMISSDDSGSPIVRTLRSEGHDTRVHVLSDSESSALSQSGNANFGLQPISESPPTATADTSFDDRVSKTSKRPSESGNNVEKDEAASSSTGGESDSNDSQLEKCPICWMRFTNQEVATPSICDHRFCLHCLMEWSKTTNTCPVDRQRFNDINVRPKFGSKVTRLVPVETRAFTDLEYGEYLREVDSEDDDYNTLGIYPESEDDEDHEAINRSSVELDTTDSREEDVDENSSSIPLEFPSSYETDLDSELSSSDENSLGENSNSPVVLPFSFDCDSSSSACNELSSSSSVPSLAYFCSDLISSPPVSPSSLCSFSSVSSLSTSSS